MEHKVIYLAYYALLRETIGISEERLETIAATAHELYNEIKNHYNLTLPENSLRISINDIFSSWQVELKTGDRVAFIPPVSGG